MSLSNTKRKGQHYQNKFAFALKTASDSKLTKRIKNTPLDFLCQRCYDQVEWKIVYKKYKPLSAPSRCADCSKKTILKAYRTLCDPCATKKIEIRVPREEATTMGMVRET
jgi:Zn finger protein HypA/HybF involved in hydrogenase expression